MGKAALIMVMGAFFAFGISNVSVFNSINQSQDVAFEFYEEVQARNIASSMVEILIQRLRNDVNMRDTIIQAEYFFDAEIGYRVIDTVLAGEDLIMIDVVAKYPDFDDNPMQKRIVNYVQMVSPLKQTIEYDYAIVSGTEVGFSGDRRIVADSCNPGINANVYTKTRFLANTMNPPSVEGFVHYGQMAWATFPPTPNDNPDGDPVMQQIADLEIGTFNHEDFIAIADSVHEGYFVATPGLTLGTKDNPMLIYVNGHLVMSGFPVPQIYGYATFIVNGRAIFSGGGLVNGDPDPEQPNIAIFATDVISMSGSVELYGLFYSLNYIGMSGTTKLHGALYSTSRVSSSGYEPFLYYRPTPIGLIERVIERQMQKSLKSVYYYE